MDINNSIKTVIRDELDSSKLTQVVYGEVREVEPLKVRIDQKIILTGNMLALSKNLTDYEVDIDVGNTGTKVSSTVYNGLKIGEMVALVSFKGGQKYLVIDRV